MQTITDELTTPLGVSGRKDRPRKGRALPLAHMVSAACLAAICGSAVFIRLFGDPLGGIPHVTVEIAQRADPPSRGADPAEAGSAQASRDNPDRQTAEQVEVSSGVAVIRPAGSAAPESIIVRVPDGPGGLAPAPDPRLVERTRFGSLPRVGQDGARALDVYARPAGELPGGARPSARVAIVVGGLGISQSATVDATAKLPPEVTLAFAPYGNDLDGLAARARAAGHEIMLQVPMEPFDYPDSDPGPHTLLAAAKPSENIEHLQWAMGRITGYVGIVNYMGGKLTANAAALQPVVKEAVGRGLGLLDDGSSSRSVMKGGAGMPVARAAVVLDASPRADQIDKALDRLEAAAQTGGIAVGSASALPVSVERIARWAKGLASRGILLMPVSAALRTVGRETASR